MVFLSSLSLSGFVTDNFLVICSDKLFNLAVKATFTALEVYGLLVLILLNVKLSKLKVVTK
jgi:hypothetical protein